MELYQKAGAKYFFSMGVHHDGFDLWNSKYQPRWNSVAMGPKKDIVGMWGAAARKRGLRFGVSEHLSNSFDWFAPSHLADTKGAYAGVPYDGQDPAYADLYHDYSGMPADFAKTAQDPWDASRRRLVEAAVLQPRQGPGRPAPARPAVHRWRHSVRPVWPRYGSGAVQRWPTDTTWQTGNGVLQQDQDRLRGRPLLCTRP